MYVGEKRAHLAMTDANTASGCDGVTMSEVAALVHSSTSNPLKTEEEEAELEDFLALLLGLEVTTTADRSSLAPPPPPTLPMTWDPPGCQRIVYCHVVSR